MDALSSMQDIVGNMGSMGNYMRDRMNEEVILGIQIEIALSVFRHECVHDWELFQSKLERDSKGHDT